MPAPYPATDTVPAFHRSELLSMTSRPGRRSRQKFLRCLRRVPVVVPLRLTIEDRVPAGLDVCPVFDPKRHSTHAAAAGAAGAITPNIPPPHPLDLPPH